MNMDHVMIDIETLGQNSSAVVCSIAAVPFSLETGYVGFPQFFKKVSIQSCLTLGLNIEADTIKWWAEQDQQTYKEMVSGTSHIKDVLYDLTLFFNQHVSPDVKVWGNGARFDLGILRDAFIAAKMPLPWKYVNERDVRTLLSLHPQAKNEVTFTGKRHHPVADSIFQINYCCLVYSRLNLSICN